MVNNCEIKSNVAKFNDNVLQGSDSHENLKKD